MRRDEIQKSLPVVRASRPGDIGLLTGEVREFGPSLIMAGVEWGARHEFTDIRSLEIRRLEDGTDMRSRVSAGRYGTIDDLRRRITYEKLQGSLTDIFYSMAAAKIDFLAYQFKPVLAFIEAPTNRLLLADEVGLGKTIEAGLIWTEVQARHHAKRLLIICPSSLRPKWIRELRERFQIDAVPADSETLLDWMSEFGRKREGLRFAGVCSYQSLRPTRAEQAYLAERYPERFRAVQRMYIAPERIRETPRTRLLERILDWQETVPFIDMTVFDEAHAMRNTATASHILGDVFASTSGASLCLSATPVHNQSRDLYALLRLVDPDFFGDEQTFDDLRRRNLPVVQLINTLGTVGHSPDSVRAEIRSVIESEIHGGSPAAVRLSELAAGYDGEPECRHELTRLATRMNLLGSFICRTRKVQVQERRVVRVPVELRVRLSSKELKLYSAVLALVRRDVRARGEMVTSFHLLSPALRMSSCIPCIVEDLRDGRWGGFDELELVREDFDIDQDVMEELAQSADVDSLAWVRDHDFEAHDTKYLTLRDDLITRVNQDKVIVFAFFKGTIRYLLRRLTADGFRAAAVTGDIQDQTLRDQLLLNFESDQNQVLLCSEVGAEGLDLQFCRVMVNYDLPWNPMRIEQRIGRIDRIGQRAERITIVNFDMLDTIDGRIYQHLYRKIGIFKSTVGDLESIIGEAVSNLTARLLSEDLTPDEETQVLEHAADAILEQQTLATELEDSKETLIAHSDFIAEQIGESRRLGRFVKPEELRLYVTDFFNTHYPGTELNWDTPIPDCGRLKLAFEAWDKLQLFANRKGQSLAGGTSSRDFYFTFDPDKLQDLRKQKRAAVLVNHLHPLIQWITEEMGGEANRIYNTAAVRVVDPNAAGTYFFLVRRLTLEGLLSKRETLHYGLIDMQTRALVESKEAERVLNLAFECGKSRFEPVLGGGEDALALLEREIDERCGRAAEDYQEEMAIRLTVKRTKVNAHFTRRLADARRRLVTMRQSDQDRAQGIRLTEAQVTHMEEARSKELADIDNAPPMNVTMDNVVCGVLEVVQT